MHNHMVEFDSPESARGEFYVTAYLHSEDGETLYTFFGRYLDRYEKRGTEWRIIRRACVHEGSQATASTPAPWSFDVLRKGSLVRGVAGRPLGLESAQ
jgi:SnoaL-like domain